LAQATERAFTRSSLLHHQRSPFEDLTTTMARLFAIAFLLTSAVALESQTVPEDCEDAECALSLRQLRGEHKLVNITAHSAEAPNETAVTPEAAAEPPAKPAQADEEEPAAAEDEEKPAAAEEEKPAAAEEEKPAAAEEEKPAAAEEEKPAAAEEEKPAAAEEEEPAAAEEEKPAVTAAEAAEDAKWGNMTQEAWETKVGGLCCFTGEDPHNTCGTCYPTAIASFKSNCAADSDKCWSCGGSWCQPKCVMGAADPNNKCGTAFPTGTAKADSFCAKDAKSCASCKGEWCRAGVNKIAPAIEEGSTEGVSSEDATSSMGGFCCYRGNVFAKNMCGACLDVAHDAACATADGCGKCGGSWCAGPRCITAFQDKADPCNSAFSYSSVAATGEYCSKSEEHCNSCKGAWCDAYNITFISGEKLDPTKELVPEEDKVDTYDDDDEDADGDVTEEADVTMPDWMDDWSAQKTK